jgi:hypothetical protein
MNIEIDNSLSVKNIIKRTMQIWGQYWLPFFLILLLANIPMFIGLGLEAYYHPEISYQADLRGHSWIYSIFFVINSITSLLAYIILYKAVTEVCQNRMIVWNEVFGSIRKVWSYIGASLMIGLYSTGIILGFSLLIVLLFFLQGLISGNTVFTLFWVLAVGLSIVGIVLLAKMLLNYSLTFAAMFVEDNYALESMSVSKSLTKGYRWFILKVFILIFILIFIPIILELLIEGYFSLPSLNIITALVTSWDPIAITLIFLKLRDRNAQIEFNVTASDQHNIPNLNS